MRSAGQIQLEVYENQEEVTATLSDLSKIKKVNHRNLSDGWTQYNLIVDSGTDTREKIHQIANKKNWRLRSLYRDQATLEDVFVELTRRD